MTTQIDIAAHLDLSTRQIRNLQDAGVLKKGAGLDEARIAYIRHLREQAAGRATTNGLNLTDERARLAKLQGDKVEIDLAIQRGDLVSVAEAEEAWMMLVSAARNRLLLLPARAADQIPGDRRETERILDDIVREALLNLSRWSPPGDNRGIETEHDDE